MANIINFPHFLEDEIRINNAKVWIPSVSNFCLTAGKEYPLMFNDLTEEWFVYDDDNSQNYAFCYIEGNYK
ncbi:hypothetical protein Desaci_2034 [Desulfosporosinus acidiphilus SJ4]|uniref:DUF5348 domain-containing protein n=1 Tax=Desulfosporosinus acidiphilus (strain DSM 22704 / JCM 16185 / SJ4) TaxID=646529 RepID=I4D5D5_DESAJ|nr:hypothetical protein [Desulfosporosinus acidiphilus]AFM41009.1 hypothetical protein Desaci_2034 [Desulfosporosinus acidiphilus SJ4]